jgi:hypothetical protein
MTDYPIGSPLLARKVALEVCGLRGEWTAPSIIGQFFGLGQQVGCRCVLPKFGMQPAVELNPFGGDFSKRVSYWTPSIAQQLGYAVALRAIGAQDCGRPERVVKATLYRQDGSEGVDHGCIDTRRLLDGQGQPVFVVGGNLAEGGAPHRIPGRRYRISRRLHKERELHLVAVGCIL